MSPRILRRACVAVAAAALALAGVGAAAPALALPADPVITAAPVRATSIVLTAPETFPVDTQQHATVWVRAYTATDVVDSVGTVTFTDASGRSYGSVYVRGYSTIPFGDRMPVGTHKITATFKPSAGGPSSTYTVPVTVTAAPVLGQVPGDFASSTTATIAGTVTAGEPFTVSAAVTTDEPQATGDAALLIDGSEVARAPLTDGAIDFEGQRVTSAGAHDVQVVYLGDSGAGIAGSSSATVELDVAYAPVRVFLAAGDTSVAGAVSNFSVRVEAASERNTQVPSGMVYLTSDSEFAGYGFLDADGDAQFLGGFVEAGATNITARYVGDDTFAADASSSKPYVVNPASTLTTVAVDPTEFGVGDGITVEVSVAIDASSSLTLQGQLEILVGDEVIDRNDVGVDGFLVPVDGVVTYTLVTDDVPAGENPLTARFTSGSRSISSSSDDVTVSASPYAATVGLSTSDLAVTAGSHGSVTVDVAARPFALGARSAELPIAWGTVQAFIGDTAVSAAVEFEDEPVELRLDVLGAGAHDVIVRYVSSTPRVADAQAPLTVTVTAAPVGPAPSSSAGLADTGVASMWPAVGIGALALAAGGVVLLARRRIGA